MSYSDLDPDYYAKREQRYLQQIREDEKYALQRYYQRQIEAGVVSVNEVRSEIGLQSPENYDNTMQFADPDWTPDHRHVVHLDLSTHDGRVEARACRRKAEQLSSMAGNPWSDFVIVKHMPEADPDLMYSIYDTESSHWVDVPFRVAWLFYGLFTLMGQLIVFGISTIVFPQMLEFYIVWGIACLLSLPFLSYWWTKYARYRHYHKLGRTHGTHHTRVY